MTLIIPPSRIDVGAFADPCAEREFWPNAAASPAVIRRLRPDDADRLQAFVRRLSPKARYLRFHTGLNELPPSLLQMRTQFVVPVQRSVPVSCEPPVMRPPALPAPP